jgi:hypothetical protein
MMGRVCNNTRGRNEKVNKKFWSENLKGRGHPEDLAEDGR